MNDDTRVVCSQWLRATVVCCAVFVLSCHGDKGDNGGNGERRPGNDAGPNAGGLLIVVDSDLSIPKDIDHILLDVTVRDRSLLHVDEQIGPDHLLIPAQWKVPAGERSDVTVRALAFQDGVPKIERSVITSIPQSHVGVLRLALHYLCVGMAQENGRSTCGEDQTCILGSCGAAAVSADSLPDLESLSRTGQQVDSISAADGGGPGCFDVRACMLEAQEVKLDAASCTFPLPDGAEAGHLNLALVLPPGDAGICDDHACYVALDSDEDWSVEGAHVRLQEDLCKRLGEHPVEVRLSTSCEVKTTRVALCGDWSPVTTPIESPLGPACRDESEQNCGKCGKKTRSCRDGRWSAFGPCQNERECFAGEQGSCGAGGVKQCKDDCTWDEACLDQRCPPGPTTQGCGNCSSGTQSRTCDRSTGKWSDWSACSGAGECAPNATRACGVQGIRSCSEDCHWSADCSGQRCRPEGPSIQPCGNCQSGTQTRSCDAHSGMWSSWSSCSGALPCAPGQTQSCGSGGIRRCGDDCQWQSACEGQRCLPEGPTTQSCGHCSQGLQTRSCDPSTGDWSDWSSCVGEGACAPHQTQRCGSSGTQTCGDNCQWELQCHGQTCLPMGSETQHCGNCNLGTQRRTCNTDTAEWSSWSACVGGGVCSPHATQSCNEGAMQVCTDACAWGPCPCAGPSSQACGRCGGTQTRTCSEGQWSPWSTCSHVTPEGGPAGGYDFDTGTNEGWTARGSYADDLDASTSSELVPLDVIAQGKSVTVRMMPGLTPAVQARELWTVEVLSPTFGPDSPFQNHSMLSFEARFLAGGETNPSVMASAVLGYRTCNHRDTTSKLGSCAVERNSTFSPCNIPITTTDAESITQLSLQFIVERSDVLNGFYLDAIHAL